ncbi:MAG: AIR synthase-related protein [Deltaproteobacteria bacterium]|nr:AIR synthase-related protein [Deltaproteobacteria bacterium]
MIHRIEISPSPGQPDPLGTATLERVSRFSNLPLAQVRSLAVFRYDQAALGPNAPGPEALGADLFLDPVLEQLTTDGGALNAHPFDWYVEVSFRPGVTDNVGRTAQESVEWRLGRPLSPGHHIHSAVGYFLSGPLTQHQALALAKEWLANEMIQQVTLVEQGSEGASRAALFRLPVVELTRPVETQTLALPSRRADLEQMSKERLLALSGEEMEAIQAHYAQENVRRAREQAGLGPHPTDVELEVLAQTWSEHCKHKIFNAVIQYKDAQGTREIRSLYKTFIQGATKEIRRRLGKDDRCVSVFSDNAGVVKFTDTHHFVFKVETHNSPSALDPYGGALTGIVGVNRDPFGTGRGADLVFNTDVFCFASPFWSHPLPPAILHPRRIYEGVRHGVEHGGNKMGVPTVNGSVTFHPGFLGKPLVFCGTGGLLPVNIAGKPGHQKWVNPGDRIVMAGGRVGADGIHGATFSSLELSEHSPVSAVQIGDPITQKKMFDFLLEARRLGLYNAITDNGAGGLSSSVGEMAEASGGADIHLDRAPVKYPGLQPWEIFVSESQERMTLAVPPEHMEELLALAARMDVEAADLGSFNNSGLLTAYYLGKPVARLDMTFLHDGVPTLRIEAEPAPAPTLPPPPTPPQDLSTALKGVLGRLNVCGKESMIRQYDHEVRGQSVVKPLTGAAHDGPSDAAVVRPLLHRQEGIVVSHGICPRYSLLDAYAMAANAFDEAVRGIIATGGSLEHISALDNFCWCDPLPSPTNPDARHKAAQLVQASQALYDLCLAYGVPLISGKDSMKNDYVRDGKRISIPPTLLVSAAGMLDDCRRAVTMDAKRPGDLVYVLGRTRPELGGSEFHGWLGNPGPQTGEQEPVFQGQVPTVRPEETVPLYRAMALATRERVLASAHDCSDGGLAVALAETAFAGGLGMTLDLGPLAQAEGLAPHELLFAESPGRFVVTVPPSQQARFEKLLAGLPCHRLGTVTQGEQLILNGGKDTWMNLPTAELKQAWQATLKDF